MDYSLFSLIGIAPLLFYLVDGYYEKNMKRGTYQIIAFLLVMGFAILLLMKFGIYFALCTPFFIIVLLIINWTKNHGMDNKRRKTGQHF